MKDQLSKYDEKHVLVKDIYGDTFTGVADYYDADYCLHEYGVDENSIIIDGYLIYESQIASIEEIEMHGTAELRSERLILRRYLPEDSEELYKYFGTDASMYEYTGWNPYATPEMAQNTVNQYIAGYADDHFYGWAIDSEDVIVGTIGAYDYEDGSIEVGFSIAHACWGRGYATEALKAVLDYLTKNEGIDLVTAWCASENTGSKRVLEKAGMKLANFEGKAINANDQVYDKLIFEYRRGEPL